MKNDFVFYHWIVILSIRDMHSDGKTDSMFLVCNGEDNQDHPNLVFIKQKGKPIKQSYDGKDIFIEKSMWPTRLAETSRGCIIVVARQKVLLLDPNLKMVKELISAKEGHYPSRMFLDEEKKKIVCYGKSKGRRDFNLWDNSFETAGECVIVLIELFLNCQVDSQIDNCSLQHALTILRLWKIIPCATLHYYMSDNNCRSW